jgi:CBS domain-containing protein
MASSLVYDVMTTEVVTAEPSTPFKEIAARLAQHRISAVPVVDADRRVLGIITEADLLLKQDHPDPEHSSLIPHLVRAVQHVEGVVRVRPGADQRAPRPR